MKDKQVQFIFQGAMHVGLCTYDGPCSIGHVVKVDVTSLDGKSVCKGAMTVNVYNQEVEIAISK